MANKKVVENNYQVFSVIETRDAPIDHKWNELAALNGNLLQSTHFDSVQAFYGYTPIYIQLFHANDLQTLVAGVKLYVYSSKKLPLLKSISRHVLQYGEIISAKKNDNDSIDYLKKYCWNYILKLKPSYFSVSGYYGNADLLIRPIGKMLSEKSFNVVVMELNKEIDTLYNGMHETHRRNIKKAEKNNLSFVLEDNIEVFLKLLNETYEAQQKKGPHASFISMLYKNLSHQNNVSLYFVKNGSDYLSAAMVIHIGKYAHYAFGGNAKNNVGAGQYLHWNIIKTYKNRGYDFYNFGQVATNNDSSDTKFIEGISRFKRSFGGFELESFSKKVLLSPVKYLTWQTLLKLTGKK